MLEEFKAFVKKNPKLISYVKKGEMSWQKFYELYDLYGEKEDVWHPYLKEETQVEKKASVTDWLTWLKEADFTALEEGIGSMQRVISMLQDLSNKEPKKTEYKPRPLYKHFED